MSKKGQKVANEMLQLRREIIKKTGTPFSKQYVRAYSQSTQDCLEILKRFGLISEYNLDEDIADP